MAETSPLQDPRTGYIFRPHELPLIPGSPATPDHPASRRLAYLLIGVFLGLVGGAQNGFLLANTPALQGEMALTPVEAGWLSVAFYSTYACMSMLLLRMRQEYGIQPFVRYAMVGLVAANFVQLLDLGYGPELAARAVAGIAASGLSALSIYYLMQGLPPAKRIGGMVLGVGLSQVAFPLARAISPALLVDGDIGHAFQLQFALSLLALGAVTIFRLPPGQRRETIEWLDLPSILLFVTGVVALVIFLIQGRIQWWDTPWLAIALAVAVLGLGGCLLLEANRRNPMLHVRWLSSRGILAMAITGAAVRVLVAEQSFGATGLFSALGYANEQLTGYHLALAGATVAGVLLSLVRLDPTDLNRPILFALLVIAIAAFADTRTGVMSRPSDLTWTQAAISFAAVYAMGPVLMEGMIRALVAGPGHMVSFIAIFSLSQTLGGLAGTAALSALHTIRLKTHLVDAGATLTATNPQLADGLRQASRALAPTLSDPALQQGAAAAQVAREAGREAAVLAFNDVFFVIGWLAVIAFVAVLIPWTVNRVRGRNPLGKELAALQSMLAGSR
ncbi:MFS transporter [Sphingomonas swuensis]|uniref:MFS transporter n=1 Tax=Sphingomonas swuensis TaxID=977800 RepID=A0ABP7SN80_9SPHN